MIEHIWTVICSSVIVDQRTNNVSIFNILEQVKIPDEAISNQVIGIGIELVTLWIRKNLLEPTKAKSRINLISPNGDVIKSAESEVDLTQYERLRSRGIFQGIPYHGEGVYRFVVNYRNTDEEKWVQVASIPLKVIHNKSNEDSNE